MVSEKNTVIRWPQRKTVSWAFAIIQLIFVSEFIVNLSRKCIKERVICLKMRVGRKIPQKLTQLSPRSHPRLLVGKRAAQKMPSKTSPATAR